MCDEFFVTDVSNHKKKVETLLTLLAFPEPSISCMNVGSGKTPLNHNPNHCVHHQPPEKFSTGDRGNPSLAWLLSSCVPVCVLCARLNLREPEELSCLSTLVKTDLKMI